MNIVMTDGMIRMPDPAYVRSPSCLSPQQLTALEEAQRA